MPQAKRGSPAFDLLRGFVQRARKSFGLESHRALGMAFEAKAVLLAEVRRKNGKFVLTKWVRFPFPEKVELEQGDRLGRALGGFLKSEGFTARRAVVGLPLRWVIAEERTVPPAGEDVLTEMLRLESERSFAAEVKRLALDYLPPAGEGSRRSVVLCGASEERLLQIRQVVESAGLILEGVTVTVGALAAVSLRGSPPGAGPAVVANLSPEAAEVAVSSGGALRRMLRLTAGTESDPRVRKERLVRELKRAAASLAWQDGVVADRFILWDATGYGDGLAAELAGTFEAGEIAAGDVSTLAELDGSAESGTEAVLCAGAAALALSAFEPACRPVDFINSRLKTRREGALPGPARLGVIAGVFLLVVVGALGASYLSAKSAVDGLRSELAQQEDVVAAADELIATVRFTDGWYGARPRYLDCLLELTKAFGEDNDLWATSVSLSEDGACIVSGKATQYRAVLSFLKRLTGSPAFAEVKLHGGISYPQSSAGRRYLTFSIRFRFRGGTRRD